MKRGGLIAMGFLAGSAVSQSLAADAPPVFVANPYPAANVWKYQITAYGWATSLNGNVGVANLQPSPVDVPFTKLIGKLEGAFMGAFYATNGQWSILTDLMWAKLSDKVLLNTPGGTQVKATQRQLIASGYVGYRLPVGSENFDLSLLAGLRYTRLTLDLTVQPGFLPLTFAREWERNWIDPLIGVSARYRINEKWFVNAVADVGGFGVGSKFTAQGFAAVGYNWTPSISTALGYRALYVDYRRAGFSYKMTQHGPFMSLAYHF
jgi:hypothetical protein